MGSESLDKLKETLRDRIGAEYGRVSREKLKRELLDRLDRLYSFELPEGLVTQEFNSIWEQVTREQQASGRGFAEENTTEEAAQGRLSPRSPSAGSVSDCCWQRSERGPRLRSRTRR